MNVVIVMRDGAKLDYVLADGRAITRHEDGSFQIDETGETLRVEA